MLIVRLCVCAANCFVSCESTHVHAEEAAAGFNREKKPSVSEFTILFIFSSLGILLYNPASLGQHSIRLNAVYS